MRRSSVFLISFVCLVTIAAAVGILRSADAGSGSREAATSTGPTVSEPGQGESEEGEGEEGGRSEVEEEQQETAERLEALELRVESPDQGRVGGEIAR